MIAISSATSERLCIVQRIHCCPFQAFSFYTGVHCWLRLQICNSTVLYAVLCTSPHPEIHPIRSFTHCTTCHIHLRWPFCTVVTKVALNHYYWLLQLQCISSNPDKFCNTKMQQRNKRCKKSSKKNLMMPFWNIWRKQWPFDNVCRTYCAFSWWVSWSLSAPFLYCIALSFSLSDRSLNKC